MSMLCCAAHLQHGVRLGAPGLLQQGVHLQAGEHSLAGAAEPEPCAGSSGPSRMAPAACAGVAHTQQQRNAAAKMQLAKDLPGRPR